MKFPLKLKWLGQETERICALLATYQPLILVSPVLKTEKALHDLKPLPYRVSKLLNLCESNNDALFNACFEPKANNRVAVEIIKLEYTEKELALIYEFYFQVYLKNISLGYLRGHTSYTYIEWLHQELLDRQFIAFVRMIFMGQVIGGCLLRRLSPAALSEHNALPETTLHLTEWDIVEIALFSGNAQFKDLELERLLLSHVAQWSRQEDYSFLSVTMEPGLIVDSDKENARWLDGVRLKPVLHDRLTSFLYCDLHRCSYLARDFHYYSYEEGEPCLHYIANVLPDFSQSLSFMNSLSGIKKIAYTRQLEMHTLLSNAGVECQLLR
jgi:hypothetical protein